MEEDRFIFEYIKNYFNKAIDFLKEENIIFLYGEPRIGKSYLAKLCMGKFVETEYYKLHLRAYHGYNPNYYTFLLGLMHSDALYEVGKEIVADIVNDADLKSIKVIGKLIENGISYKQKFFPYLNDSEISIINRKIYPHISISAQIFLYVDTAHKIGLYLCFMLWEISHIFFPMFICFCPNVVNPVVHLCAKDPVHLSLYRRNDHMCVVVKGHGDVGMSHDVLQRFGIHPRIG